MFQLIIVILPHQPQFIQSFGVSISINFPGAETNLVSHWWEKPICPLLVIVTAKICAWMILGAMMLVEVNVRVKHGVAYRGSGLIVSPIY